MQSEEEPNHGNGTGRSSSESSKGNEAPIHLVMSPHQQGTDLGESVQDTGILSPWMSVRSDSMLGTIEEIGRYQGDVFGERIFECLLGINPVTAMGHLGIVQLDDFASSLVTVRDLDGTDL